MPGPRKKTASQKRVVMTHRVATSWLHSNAEPEFRLIVYRGARDIRNLPNMLKSFRDGQLKVGSVNPITDLGIQEGFDTVTVWSRDRKALSELQAWIEERGLETSGIGIW